MSAVFSSARFLSQVWLVPTLFPRISAKRRNSGCSKGDLVGGVMDQISDMLTRIRNAITRKYKEVRIPHSKMKFEVARIMLEEGFINNFIVEGNEPHKKIFIQLKYTENGRPAIFGLKRISLQSRRVYRGVVKIPRTIDGWGVTILSTSKGILTDREARKEHIGGEVICQIW